MDRKGQQLIAYSLIGLGVLLLAGNFFNIDPGRIIWPLVLIIAGVILVTRPQLFNPSGDVRYMFAGDIVIDENWTVRDEEIRLFAGDVKIDLARVDIPPGETIIAVRFFAGSINVRLPSAAALRVIGNGFVIDSEINGDKRDNILAGLQYESPEYEAAESQIQLLVSCFACDLDIVQV
jgi:predicted membrane protein